MFEERKIKREMQFLNLVFFCTGSPEGVSCTGKDTLLGTRLALIQLDFDPYYTDITFDVLFSGLPWLFMTIFFYYIKFKISTNFQKSLKNYKTFSRIFFLIQNYLYMQLLLIMSINAIYKISDLTANYFKTGKVLCH